MILLDTGGDGGETRETIVSRLVSDMLDKVPEYYKPYEVMDRLKEMGNLNSMVIFLRQEIDRMQRVSHIKTMYLLMISQQFNCFQILVMVRESLTDLLLAIDGTIIMNEQLADAFDNIYNAKLPSIWKRGSWQSSTLGFWFTELLERDKQFRTWCFEVISIE